MQLILPQRVIGVRQSQRLRENQVIVASWVSPGRFPIATVSGDSSTVPESDPSLPKLDLAFAKARRPASALFLADCDVGDSGGSFDAGCSPVATGDESTDESAAPSSPAPVFISRVDACTTDANMLPDLEDPRGAALFETPPSFLPNRVGV